MVFKRLLGALGVGGPSVDTVLTGGPVMPGGTLYGQVHLEGGDTDADIHAVVLELVARVEAEGGHGYGYEDADGEHEGVVVLDRAVVGGGFRLPAGARHTVPFSLPVPWEAPVTELHGQSLGIALGIRTGLEVAGARDKGDLDPLSVAPLPAQEAILEALGQLGFGFTSADLEMGHLHGTGQRLPFYQEIELTPPAQYAHAVSEIELTFLADPAGVEVVLEADKRGGLFSEGHDQIGRFTVDHATVLQVDWTAEVDSWIRRLVEHRGGFGAPAAHGHGHGYGHGHDHGHHDEHHGSGMGVGTAVAAGAAGLAAGAVGGYLLSEAVDEFFDDEDENEADDNGDDEEDEGGDDDWS
ncbi:MULTISPECIES: sporulation protein [unclassified Streptomyces]|uniref:sporulation protein n=1 Tax=unclassified Streptomyces TaxID=2593676 RepID=UPI0038223424